MITQRLNRFTQLLLGSIVVTLFTVSSAYAAVLEEIVVTAQKREQSLSDVPVTVNALSGETLEDFDVDDLFEVANLVNGMVFSRAPDDGLALTLRGLGTPARTQSFDQSVALFLDGMFVGKGRMYSSAFFDVERMEVIKGTQSTLLGKNTSLGAISIVTRKPGAEVSGDFEINADVDGDGDGWGFDGGVDLPISDNLQLRLAAHYVDQEGWVENLITGEDVPADEDTGIRATAVYTPSDDLTVTATYQYTDSERQGNGFQFIDNGGNIPPDVLAILGEMKLDDTKTADCPECPGRESFHDTEVDSFSVTIEKDFGSVLLTSVTSYATYDMEFFDDFDFGAAFDEVNYVILNPGTVTPYSTYFERDEEYDQISQEFRLTSPAGENIEYVAGLFYFKSEWESSEQQFWSTPNFPPPMMGQIFNGPFVNNFSQDTETVSVFGQVTMNLTDRLRGSIGLRYTDEQKDVVFQRVQGAPATIWNSVLNPPFDTPLEFDDSFVNGNVNLQFDATDDVMLYVSYGLGSKAGGFAESAEVRSANPGLPVELDGAQVETEAATTWELGAKSRLLNGALSLNVAIFQTEIADFQETSFQVSGGDAKFLTRNIDVESEGFEIDGEWQVTEQLRILGGFTYADSINAGDGTTLAQAPEWTGSLGFLFERELSSDLLLTLNGFVRYRDEMVSQINETFPSDDLTTADLVIGISNLEDTWSVSLIGTNITDELATDFSGPPAAPIGAIFGAVPGDQGITSEAPSQLRTIKLQATYRF